MGPGSTPWLPVVEVYLSGENDGMPWVVSVWGTALFPAWVLVQQESVGLNLGAWVQEDATYFWWGSLRCASAWRGLQEAFAVGSLV